MKPPYRLGGRYFMRNPMILLMILSSGLLAACTAPVLPDLNANLRSVNASLKSTNDTLRGTSSLPPTVATAPADVCDPAAFQAGFKDQYVADWNSEVGRKQALFRLQSQQHPEDTVARHNYTLYRGQLLSGKGVGDKAIVYGLKFDNNGHIQNDCQARSYQQGKTAGGTAAITSFKALANQEI